MVIYVPGYRPRSIHEDADFEFIIHRRLWKPGVARLNGCESGPGTSEPSAWFRKLAHIRPRGSPGFVRFDLHPLVDDGSSGLWISTDSPKSSRKRFAMRRAGRFAMATSRLMSNTCSPP